MPASQYQRYTGLRQALIISAIAKTGLDVAAHGIEYDQHSVNLRALLHCHQLRYNMFVLGSSLRAAAKCGFYLPNDGDTVNPGHLRRRPPAHSP